MGISLSLCMIVKNEERTLGRVLAAARQFCDEMIVVDTGSTDNTVALALEHGARVEHFAWCDDFAAARNYSFSLATGDWIIWLDADDVVPEATIALFPQVKQVLDTTDAVAVFCPYEYIIEDGEVKLLQSRERIVKRGTGLHWKGKIHECIANIGDRIVTMPEVLISHQPTSDHMARKVGRNLAIMDQFMTTESTDCRDLYLWGTELKAAGRLVESAAAHKRYLEVWPAEQYDPLEGPYMTQVQLSDTYLRLGDFRQAVREALLAVCDSPARAEAYFAAAHAFYSYDCHAEAFPLFLAAAGCKPPAHAGLVFHAFYSPNLDTVLKDCQAKIKEKEVLTLQARNASIV